MDDGSHVIGCRRACGPGGQDLAQLGSGVTADPAGQCALRTDDADHGPGLEVAVDADEAGQQERLLADGQGPDGTGIGKSFTSILESNNIYVITISRFCFSYYFI